MVLGSPSGSLQGDNPGADARPNDAAINEELLISDRLGWPTNTVLR